MAGTGNKDGKITKDEIQAFVGKDPVPEAFFKRTFDRGDKNGDGVLEGRGDRHRLSPAGQFCRRRSRPAGEAAAEQYISPSAAAAKAT